MLAVIDETTPFVAAGVHYALISCLLLSGEEDARPLVLAAVPAGRRRPFHWYREGPAAREGMLGAAEKIGVVGRAIVVPCGRRRQEAARQLAMSETVAGLQREGCTRLIIESRHPVQDGRDRRLLAELLGEPPSVACSWENKSEPLLWMADAVGGAVLDHLLGNDAVGWFDRFSVAVGLTVEYRQLPAI